MLLSDLTCLKLQHYKCFNQEGQGFEKILPINIIVGRNNSGKSALLDAVELLVRPYDARHHSNQDTSKEPKLIFGKTITESEVNETFPDSRGIVGLAGVARDYGQNFVGANIVLGSPAVNEQLHREIISLDPDFEIEAAALEYRTRLAQNLDLGLQYVVRRLRADRDIRPGQAQDDPHLDSEGNGATSYLWSFQRHESGNEDIVNNEFMSALNEIFHPYTKFNRVDVKKLRGKDEYEIYLYEDGKKSVKLSNSGSGFKTIILILINLLLVPDREGRSPSEYIYCFEEIENNLHPGLQRRLFEYIKAYIRRNNAHLVLTTHSNVLLDSMQTEEDVQILHVTKTKDMPAEVRTVKTTIENHGILDDLDIKASDLLQANSIVWVEGPSDRIYIKKFIDLYTKGKLREDLHYQIVFYGGRLLAHLEYGGGGEGVDILKVNRRSIMVMDSDFSAKTHNLTPGKRKMRAAINNVNGVCWVTKGREIENYIASAALGRILNKSVPQVAQYGKFDTYLEKNSRELHTLYKRSKSLFSEKVSPALQAEDINVLDLAEQLKIICTKMASWNGIKL